MTLGAGIAIAGVWAATAVVCRSNIEAGVIVAILALIATVFICGINLHMEFK